MGSGCNCRCSFDELEKLTDENTYSRINDSILQQLSSIDQNYIATLQVPCYPVFNTTQYYPVLQEQPKRIRCKYCDCLSEKDYGLCEHCGAPL